MRLFLISLDAVGQNDCETIMKLPALSALKAQGTFCNAMQTIYPTITYPIHTSLITGCYPEKHGIVHNQPFQPDTEPVMRKWHWSREDNQCKTLWDAAKENHKKVASILWPVSGKNKAVQYSFPEVLPLPGENKVLKMLEYASPLWILKMELLYGKHRKSILQPDLDDYATLLCEKMIHSKNIPDFLSLHLVDLDFMRHAHGTRNQEAFNAMERLDRCVGRIVKALKETNQYDDTVIAIVSDHGHQEVTKTILLDDILRENGVGRAQSLGLGAYIYTDNLKATTAYLNAHKDELGIQTIYQKDELKQKHLGEEIALSVQGKPGVAFGDKAEKVYKSDHGFDDDAKEAKCMLLLVGKPFQKNHQLQNAHVVDVAPTLAKVMGWSLPNAQGKVLSETFKKR